MDSSCLDSQRTVDRESRIIAKEESGNDLKLNEGQEQDSAKGLLRNGQSPLDEVHLRAESLVQLWRPNSNKDFQQA